MRYLCLLAALLLTGCVGGSRSGGPVAATVLSPDSSPSAAIPFPTDRAASTLTGLVILGKDTQARSGGDVVQGNALVLPATGAAQWAVYEFTGVTQAPDHVEVALDAAQTTTAWIGIADFAKKRWVLSGPFTSAQTIPLTAAANVSPLENVYAAVVVSSAENSKIDQLQLFTPNVVPVASFTATPQTGNPGDSVQLDASGSTDPDGSIENYEWDLDGDGVFEVDTGAIPTQATTLPNPAGSMSVSLRVTDNGGATNTATLSLTSFPTGWQTLTVDSVGTAGAYTSLAVVNGHPAISYYDGINNVLKFAHSISPDGSGNWSTLTVDSAGDVGTYTSLVVVNGNPAICYRDVTNLDLKYAYSNSVDGKSGWSTITVDSLGDVGRNTSLRVVGGYPAVSYYDETIGDLKYAYSSMLDGSGGWSTLTVDSTAEAGLYNTSLAAVDGKPAISYGIGFDGVNGGGLRFAYSSTVDGSSGWSSVTVEGGDVGADTSQAVINGYPAISQYDYLNRVLKFAYSSTIDGNSGWSTLTLYNGGSSGTSLAAVNGNPAISFYDEANGDLKFASSSSADGANVTDWSVTTIDSPGDVGRSNSLVVLTNGQPAISYYDATNGTLKYAVLH